MKQSEGNTPGQKYIYRDSVIRTAKRYDLLKLLSSMERKKLVQFPEEDVSIIRYLTYFIANNYKVYSQNSKKFKNTVTVSEIIDQASYINLEIKPFHVLVSYACASSHLMKITSLKYRIKNAKLHIIPKEKITHIPFDESYIRCSRYYSKKQELEFRKIGLKRHVNVKNKLRATSKVGIITGKIKTRSDV